LRRFHESFQFCPRCGGAYTASDFDEVDVLYRCARCGLDFYQNSIPAATVVIPRLEAPHEVVLIVRDNEPRRGFLALPGGFLKYGEDPASGARREAIEEAGLETEIERLLFTTLVDYEYLGSRLWTLEMAFLAAPVDAKLDGVRTSEARTVAFHDVRELVESPDRLAFPEQRGALAAYLDPRNRREGSGSIR
jgi:ADP-ribose pyrophosphatase YjhB (NUDIX family)